MRVSGGPVDRMDARGAGHSEPAASLPEADLRRGLDADDLPLVDLQEHGAELDLPQGPSHDSDRLLVAEVGVLGLVWYGLMA